MAWENNRVNKTMRYIDPQLSAVKTPRYSLNAETTVAFLRQAIESLCMPGVKIATIAEKDAKNVSVILSLESDQSQYDLGILSSIYSFLGYFNQYLLEKSQSSEIIQPRFYTEKDKSYVAFSMPLMAVQWAWEEQKKLQTTIDIFGALGAHLGYGGIPFLSSSGAFIKSMGALPSRRAATLVVNAYMKDPSISFAQLVTQEKQKLAKLDVTEEVQEEVKENLTALNQLKTELSKLALSFDQYRDSFNTVFTLFGSVLQISFPQAISDEEETLNQYDGFGEFIDQLFKDQGITSANGEARSYVLVGGRYTWNFSRQQIEAQPQILEIIWRAYTLALELLASDKIPTGNEINYLEAQLNRAVVARIFTEYGMDLPEKLEQVTTLDEGTKKRLEAYLLNKRFKLTMDESTLKKKSQGIFSSSEREKKEIALPVNPSVDDVANAIVNELWRVVWRDIPNNQWSEKLKPWLERNIVNKDIQDKVLPTEGGINLFYLRVYEKQIAADLGKNLKLFVEVVNSATQTSVDQTTDLEKIIITSVSIRQKPTLAAAVISAAQQATAAAKSPPAADSVFLRHAPMTGMRLATNGGGASPDNFENTFQELREKLEQLKSALSHFTFIYGRNPSAYNFNAMDAWNALEKKLYEFQKIFLNTEKIKEFYNIPNLASYERIQIDISLKSLKNFPPVQVKWIVDQFLAFQKEAHIQREKIRINNEPVRDSLYKDQTHFDSRILAGPLPDPVKEFTDKIASFQNMCVADGLKNRNLAVYIPVSAEMDDLPKGGADKYDYHRYLQTRLKEIIPAESGLSPAKIVFGFDVIWLNADSAPQHARGESIAADEVTASIEKHGYASDQDDKSLIASISQTIKCFDPCACSEEQLDKPFADFELRRGISAPYKIAYLRWLSTAVNKVLGDKNRVLQFFISADRITFYFNLQPNSLKPEIAAFIEAVRKNTREFSDQHSQNNTSPLFFSYGKKGGAVPAQLSIDPPQAHASLSALKNPFVQKYLLHYSNPALLRLETRLGPTAIELVTALAPAALTAEQPYRGVFFNSAGFMRRRTNNYKHTMIIRFPDAGRKEMEALKIRHAVIIQAMTAAVERYNTLDSPIKKPEWKISEEKVGEYAPKVIANILDMMLWRSVLAVYQARETLQPFTVYLLDTDNNPDADNCLSLKAAGDILALHDQKLSRANLIARFVQLEKLCISDYKSSFEKNSPSSEQALSAQAAIITEMKSALQDPKNNVTALCLSWMHESKTALLLRDVVFPNNLNEFAADFSQSCERCYSSGLKGALVRGVQERFDILASFLDPFLGDVLQLLDPGKQEKALWLQGHNRSEVSRVDLFALKFTNPVPITERVRLIAPLRPESRPSGP